jgi:hypothetical protein
MRRRVAEVIASIAVVGSVSAWVGVPQRPNTWKTFTSEAWGVALDYPPDWTVDNDGDEVTFRSASAATIVLGRTATDAPSEPAPGRRAPKPDCTTTTTVHDVAATVCVDPTSSARRAVLVLKTRNGRQYRLALRTREQDPQIFDAILASVRRYPQE